MKERPILFSAPMVRALLAGTKTQTRRVGKPVRHPDLGNLYDIGAFVLEHEPQHVIERACPYGQPGDRLWVRETHAPQADCLGAWHNWSTGTKNGPKPIIHYAADGGDPFIEKWRPSIHMPRWASRITLEIVSVRVERLQEISVLDAIAEGVIESAPHLRDLEPCMEWRYAYEDLWRSINGPGSWDANPWVWVVEFKRVSQ